MSTRNLDCHPGLLSLPHLPSPISHQVIQLLLILNPSPLLHHPCPVQIHALTASCLEWCNSSLIGLLHPHRYQRDHSKTKKLMVSFPTFNSIPQWLPTASKRKLWTGSFMTQPLTLSSASTPTILPPMFYAAEAPSNLQSSYIPHAIPYRHTEYAVPLACISSPLPCCIHPSRMNSFLTPLWSHSSLLIDLRLSVYLVQTWVTLTHWNYWCTCSCTLQDKAHVFLFCLCPDSRTIPGIE